MKRLILLSIIFLTSCGIGAATYPSEEATNIDSVRLERCLSLNSQHRAWVAVATVGGSIAGGATTVTPIINEYISEDRDKWIIGISITGLVGAGASVLGGVMTSEVENEWNELKCSDYL